MWMCASLYMGCIANTKGTPVMSSKSAAVLGLTAGPVGPLPLRAGAPGVEGSTQEGNSQCDIPLTQIERTS